MRISHLEIGMRFKVQRKLRASQGLGLDTVSTPNNNIYTHYRNTLLLFWPPFEVLGNILLRPL